MTLKPMHNRVLILPSEPEAKTKGGLIIPETAQEKPSRGQVVAVGPGTDGEMMTLVAGDWVLYGKYAGNPLEYEGKEYVIMRESEILAVVD